MKRGKSREKSARFSVSGEKLMGFFGSKWNHFSATVCVLSSACHGQNAELFITIYRDWWKMEREAAMSIAKQFSNN